MPVGLWGYFSRMNRDHTAGAGMRRNGKAIAKRRGANKRARSARRSSR